MANLDPRLFQLFETLVQSKADWLVFELIEGIEAGIVVEEAANDLASARIQARQARQERPRERIAVSPESRPIEGANQVVWAAHYVANRLKDVLATMDVAAERLNMLVDPNADIGIKARQTSVTLGLRVDDGLISVGPEARVAARLAVINLVVALESWVHEVTDGGQAI